MKQPKFVRNQRSVIVSGILCIVVMILILQLWLFTATMDAYLRGDQPILIPAFVASSVCLLLNMGLLWYLYALEK